MKHAEVASLFKQQYPWLVKRLPRAEAAAFYGHLRRRNVEPGDVLIEQGKRNDSLYFAPSAGLAIELRDEADAPKHTLALGGTGSGAQVGDLGVLRPGPASATVRATAAVTVFVLTHEDLMALLDGDSPAAGARIALRLARVIAGRVRAASAVTFHADGAGGDTYSSAFGKLHIPGDAIPTHIDLIPHGLGRERPKPTDEDATALMACLVAEEELAPLGDDCVELIARSVELRRYAPGETVVSAEDGADGLYYIVRGTCALKVEKGADKADFAVAKELGAGRLFGQVAFLLDGERSATVTAREDGALIGIFSGAAVQMMLLGGGQGARVGSHFLLWMGAELADDARELSTRLRDAHTAWRKRAAT